MLEDELEDLHAGLALFRHDHHTHDLPGRMHGQGLLNGSGYAHRQGQDGPAFQTEAEATDSSARGSGRLIIVVVRIGFVPSSPAHTPAHASMLVSTRRKQRLLFLTRL